MSRLHRRWAFEGRGYGEGDYRETRHGIRVKMGCNTSKESVQPVGDEAKEDVKNGGECYS